MIVTAIFKAKSGHETELRKLIHETAAQSWVEFGVQHYTVHEIEGSPGSFMNVELYADEAAFDEHLTTPHVKVFLAALDDLLESPAQVYRANTLFAGEHPKGTF